MIILLLITITVAGETFGKENAFKNFNQQDNNKLQTKQIVELDFESEQIIDVTLTKVLNWMEKPYMIILQKKKASLYEMDRSSLKLMNSLSIPSPSGADIVETIEEYGDLWIIQGSFDSPIIMITKIILIDLYPKILNTLLISLSGHVNDVHALKTYTNSYIIVTYQNSTKKSIYCLSCGETVNLVNNFETLANATMDTLIVNEKIYLLISNATHETYYVFDPFSEELSILHQSTSQVTPSYLLRNAQQIYAVQLGPGEVKKILAVNDTAIKHTNNWKSPDIHSSRKIINMIGLSDNKEMFIYVLSHNLTMDQVWTYDLSCSDATFESALFEDGILLKINCYSRVQLIFIDRPIDGRNLPHSGYLSDHPMDKDNLEGTLYQYEKELLNYRHEIKSLEMKIEFDQLDWESITFYDFEDEIEPEDEFTYNHQKGSNVNHNLTALKKVVMKLYEQLQNVRTTTFNMLSYTGIQRINSDIVVNRLMATDVNMFNADIVKINGISIDTYKEDYLNVESDQVLTGEYHFSTLFSSNATIRQLTDEMVTLRPKDLMFTNSPNQFVTGNHQYSSVVIQGGSIISPENYVGRINGIDIDELALRNSNVVFKQRKEFSKTVQIVQQLAVKKDINKIPYMEWKRKLMPVAREATQITNPVVIRGNLTVLGNVHASLLNGINFSVLDHQVANKLTRPLEITGPMKFENLLHVDNLIVDRVNGFDWKDVLRIKDSEVKANFHLDKVLVLGDVSGLVNDIDFSKDVLLTEGDQIIQGETTFFSDVNVLGLGGVTMEPLAKINNIDPSEDAVFLKKIYNQNDVFNRTLEVDGDVEIELLNNIYTEDISKQFWTQNSQQKIHQDISISEAEFARSVKTRTMNKKKLTEYFLTDYQQIISGQNIFTAHVEMDNLEIANGHTIDGVEVSDFKSYVINRNKRQTLNRKLGFTNIYVENLKVGSGMLGNFNLSRAVHSANPIHSGKLVFYDPVSVDVVDGDGSLLVSTLNKKTVEEVFGNKQHSISVITGSLTVDRLNASDITVIGKLNDRNITEWFKNAVFQSEKSATISRAHIKGKVYFEGSVELEKVNGKSWKQFSKEVSQSCLNCSIIGKKTFTNRIDFMTNFNVEYINGQKISELVNKLLLKSHRQTITGKYTFNSDLITDNAIVNTISGIPVDKILLVNSPAMLTGTTEFAAPVKFHHIFAPHSWMSGCNLIEAMTKPKFQQIYYLNENMSFGHIYIMGNLTSRGKIISRSGKNHISILKNLVQKSKKQLITGKVSFISSSSVNHLKADTLNGRSADSLLAEHPQESSLDIYCDLTFSNHLKVEKLKSLQVMDLLSMKINGFSTSELYKYSIPKYSNEKINGKKYFNNNLTVKGNMLTKNLNGHTHSDFLTVNSDLSNQEIIFNEVIIIKKLIDNSSDGLSHSVVKTARDWFGFPNTAAKTVNLHLRGNLQVDSVNGINLSDLVLKHGGSQHISGKKTFDHLVIDGEANVKIINDVSIIELLSESSWPLKKVITNKEIIQDTSLIPKLKSDIEALNKQNNEFSKKLHTKLVDVRPEQFLSIKGVQKIEDYRIRSEKRGILAIAKNPDACVQCSCSYQTHTLKVQNDKFVEDKMPYKGIYFMLNSDDFTGELYDFGAGCTRKPVMTRFREVIFDVGHSTFSLQEELIDLGIVQKVNVFREDVNTYFIILSREEDYSQLQILSTRNLTEIQKFNGNIMGFDYTKIGDEHHLIVISQLNSSSIEGKTLTESSHYMWNKLRKLFKKKFIFLDESVASVKFVNNGEEHLLIFGDIFGEICHEYCYIKNKPGKIKVYKKMNDLFKPFSVLSVGEITSIETFVIYKQLFMAVTLASNILHIYEYKGEEGMRLIQEINVKNPTDASYLRNEENHYLSVVQSNEGILLLKLVIAGVDGLLK